MKIRSDLVKIKTAYTSIEIQIAAEIVSSAAPYFAEIYISFNNPNSKNHFTRNFLESDGNINIAKLQKVTRRRD